MAAVPKSLREIFDDAVEINDVARRADFVRSACAGDEALRARVEQLLRAHQTAGGFFNPETAATPAAVQPGISASGLPSQRIGRYRLLHKLGEGGCGVVYMAEQTEPVRRRVALKIIKLGMDTRSVIARFEAERQALALMDHPHIARVLDAGATETGRPFFVMELVRGVKITEFCDEHNLSTKERLGLFVQVCHAVQHAHQKGIIHRDLKPNNILVSLHDALPVPKVIDFGIAKAATDVQLTDKTVFTQFELLIGTPAYMSPEQAEGSGLDIDTRSDIYSLGVLLYELLTGQTPFDTQSLLKSGLDTMRKTIRETEPVRPSTRLRSLTAADLTTTARRRRADPLKLISSLRGDLDWIVLKALEKDRARRYETANALAADARRFLSDEAVMARPPSRLYLLKKLARRNRAAFAGGAMVMLALLIGCGISTALLFKERSARRDADAARSAEAQQRAAASAKAEESRQSLVRLNISQGNRRVEDGDFFGALLPFLDALKLEESQPVPDPSVVDLQRRRLGVVQRLAPQILGFWAFVGLAGDACFSPDGRWLAVAGDNRVSLFDSQTGDRLWPSFAPSGGVSGIRWPVADRLLLADESGCLRFWDPRTGKPLGPVMETRVQTTTMRTSGDCIDVSADGKWLLAVTADGVELFDTATSRPVRTGLGREAAVRRVRFSPGGERLAVAGEDGLRMWSLSGSEPPWELSPKVGPLRLLAFSPKGDRLVTSSPGRLDVWDVARRERITRTIALSGSAYDCAFTRDGRRIVIVDQTAARVFDAQSGQLMGAPMEHRSHVPILALSEDGRFLATGSYDQTARVWNLETGQPASPILQHAGAVNFVHFGRQGTRLLTGGSDGTVRFWALPSDEAPRLVLREAAAKSRAVLSSNGRRVLRYGPEGSCRVWDLSTGQPIAALDHPAPVVDAQFSADCGRIVTACQDGRVRIWKADPKPTLLAVASPGSKPEKALFSADGLRMLSVSEDHAVQVWSSATGAPIGPPMKHPSSLWLAMFSPDSQTVLTSCQDGLVRLWDPTSGERIGPASSHEWGVTAAAFSPDGKRLVTVQKDLAQVWDPATGKPAGNSFPIPDVAASVEFDPGGRRVVIASWIGQANITDPATGRRAGPVLRQQALLEGAKYSPDGRMVLTFGMDRTARVWDAASGEPVTPPLPHGGSVLSATWTTDGREIATTCSDGLVRVWDASPAEGSLQSMGIHAELLAGERIEEGRSVPLDAAELSKRWEALWALARRAERK